MRLKVFICLLLAGITLAIYWPANQFTLLFYDDGSFLQSPQVAAGISPEGINWAMTGVVAYNWHPITTFSFLLTHEFFGLDPGAEHLVNIVFHAANAVLLFLVLTQLTGSRVQSPESAVQRSEATGSVWCCAIVAAIFAWHPLHVESVAWIAERKDVLFTFFMLLSLWCYALYAQAEQPSPHGEPDQARPHPQEGEHLAREDKLKLELQPGPLPQETGKLSDDNRTSETQRPSPDSAAARTAQRAVPTVGFLSRHAYYNWALVFFILSFLSKAMVVTLPFLLLLLDYWPLQRLNRLTLRGLIFEKWRFFALMIFFCLLTFRFQRATGATVSLNYIGMTARLENTALNYAAYLGKFFWPVNLAIPNPFPASFDIVQVLLGALLLLAISAFCILQMARRPYLAVGWFWYLGTMVPVIGLVQLGVQGMEDRYTYITLIGPSISLVWLVWEGVRNHSWWKYATLSATAVILAVCAFLTEKQLQFWKDTVTLFSHSIAVTPENPVAEEVLAVGLEDEGLLHQAAVHYRIACDSHHYGDHFMSNFRMAELMMRMGYDKEAETRLEAALQFVPNSPDTMNNLAWLLATSPDAKARNGAHAVQVAEQACELTHDQNPKFMTTLAAAYAEAGRFDDAIDMTQKTIALADQYGLDSLSEANRELLQTYTAHQTYAQTHPQSKVNGQ